eukprot:TRINITY_DN9225_c0_g4_i1.p1 TRINITY_DN9225_c0_g4~~TRINITY_DN9225_c0_g4_i1.p1  ORF type:complete len:733 (-),score=78.46 TRINITY_DN9225_c0_g4_i1:77-2179(-)
MSCDSRCPNCNQEDCLKDYVCTDSTDPVYGIWSGSLSNVTESCFYEVVGYKPWDTSPKRVYLYNCPNTVLSPVFPCIDINQIIPSSDCNPKSISNLLGGNALRAYLLKPATSKEECEKLYVCWGYPRIYVAGYDFYFDSIPKEACNDPSWRYDTLWKWKNKHTWKGGRPRHPTWTQRKYDLRYVNGTIFDFLSFTQKFQQAVDALYNQEVQSFLFCQYSRTNELLANIVCNCIEGKSEVICSQGSGKAISDIATYCSGYKGNLVSPPFTFLFTQTSAKDRLCHTLYFQSVSITLYLGSGNKPHLTSVIINFEEDYMWGLRNKNSAIWGKVLTDGIYVFAMNSTVTNFTDVVLTATKYPERWNPDMNNYPILDLAYSEGNSTVLIPLNLTVNLTADNSAYQVHMGIFTVGRTYFIVQRVSNWDTLERTVFSNGEIAYMSVIVFLYVILLIACGLKLLNAYRLELPFHRLIVLLIIIFIFCIFRIVLFSIAISQVIVDLSPAAIYTLTEFPIILYFIYVSNYIISWAFARAVIKNFTTTMDYLRTTNYLTLTLNLIILIVFVIVIILYEVVVGNPESACNGEVVLWNSNAAHIINVVYRCIFGGIDICFALFQIVVGISFYHLITKYSEGETSERVLLVSIVGGGGLLAQGIIWIIFPVTRQTPSNFVTLSILLMVEILPTFIFIILVNENSIALSSPSPSA